MTASTRKEAPPSESETASETAILTIDLDALVANYDRLRDLAQPAECAAVVKADAYGVGMAKVAPALARAGCKTFFVATLDEAKALRALLPDSIIYVFAGLIPGTAELYRTHNLRPVLNSPEEIRDWASFCSSRGEKLACSVHMDSGMNRLGLSAAEVEQLSQAGDLWRAFTLSMVMSHLACADEPRHPKNEMQRAAFDRLRALLPRAPASLANSAGILLGTAYTYDIARPGIALYGGKPSRDGEDFEPVVELKGRILQLREIGPGESVGYGAARTLSRPRRVAVVAVGYADGFFRALSNKDSEDGFVVYAGPHPAPIVGRVSMDLITVDVSNVPEPFARRGGWIELIGRNVTAQAMAERARTIDYEVLTNLGSRALRRYIGG